MTWSFTGLAAPSPARRVRCAIAGVAAFLIVPVVAAAQTVTHVTSEATFRAALANAQNGDTIVFDNDVVLAAGDLPAVNVNVTIQGNTHKLSGAVPVKSGTGTMSFDSTSTNFGGNQSVTGGTLGLAADTVLRDGAVVGLNDNTTLSFDAAGTYTHRLTIAGSSALRVSLASTVGQGGRIDDGASAGTLVLIGGGTLVLTNTGNSYTGGTFVKDNSTLQVDSDTELGAATGGVQLGDSTTGGTLLFGSGVTTGRAITLGLAGGTVNTNGFDATLSGAITGSGGLTKAGLGTLILSSANNGYGGATSVAAGTLRAGAANVFGTGSAVSVSSGTTLDLNNFNQAVGSLSGAGSVTLGSATLTAGSDNTNTTFSGVMSGTGALVKTGTGTLTLTGANTYTGGTTISGGTLSGNAASLQGTIVDNAALIFNQDSAGTFSGTVSGTGTLTKTGAGTLTLNGTQSLTGLTTVSQGTLLLRGTLGGAATVSTSATLAGSGTVNGLTVNGIVAPDSAATLRVTGSVTLSAGSIYRATIDSAGRPTLIQATGTAAVGGAIVNVAASTPAARVTQAVILSATGGVTGAVTTQSGTAALGSTVTNDGRNLVLTLFRTDLPLATAVSSTNAAAAGAAIDRLRATATGDLAIVARELSALDDPSLGPALDAVAGEIHASTVQLAAADGEATAELIHNEVLVRRPGDLDVPTTTVRAPWGSEARWWAQLVGQHSAFKTGAGAYGADANLGGVAVGVDRAFADSWLAGVGGGYSLGRLTLTGLSASSNLKEPRAFAYVGYASGRLAVDAGSGLAWTSYDTTRHVAFTAQLASGQPLFGGIDRTAKSTQHGLAPDVWGNWQFNQRVNDWRIEPGIGVRYARYGRRAWSETGADSLSLSASSQAQTSSQAQVGLRAEHGGRFHPFGVGIYRRELTNARTSETLQLSSSPAGVFTINGLALGRDTVIGGVGMTMQTRGRMDVSLSYQARHASRQTRQTINLGIGF